MKPQVVNVLADPPDYGAGRAKSRPPVSWGTPDGRWVGVWGYDWPDQLGAAVLARDSVLDFEVWQPDTRADTVYAHTFPNGLTHRLFPARETSAPLSFGLAKEVFSAELVARLREVARQRPVVVQLNGLRGATAYRIYEAFCDQITPIMVTGHGSFLSPRDQCRTITRHPLKKLSLWREDKMFRRLVTRVDMVADENAHQVAYIGGLLGRPVGYLVMGSDFSFWTPAGEGHEVHPALATARTAGRKVFLSVAAFTPRKRLDRMIELFDSLPAEEEFCLVLVGEGDDAYAAYLSHLGGRLVEAQKLVFIGYTQGKELRQVYRSADFYISLSRSEGTQVATEHAAGVGLPIIATENNGIADTMLATRSGLRLPNDDPYQWRQRIIEVLHGRPVRPIPREHAKRLYDWENVADRFIEVYRAIFLQAYGVTW